MNDIIYILGIGDNSIVTIELAEQCGYKIGGLYHYKEGRTGERVYGHEIIGTFDELFATDITGMNFALSMGDNDIRADLFKRIKEAGGLVPRLIHPSAVVSRYSSCDEGVQLHANSVVDPDVKIGADTVVSDKSTVLHGCRVGAHVFFAPDAVIGAMTHVDDYAFVGQNATVISRKAQRLGYHSVVGAAAVVTKPVADFQTVAGSPAKELKRP